MLTSYHNHTLWSDGKSPLEDMLSAAREFKLDEIGISDHLTCSPEGKSFDWSMPLSFLPEYVSTLTAAAAAERTSLKIRTGIEADFFEETAAAVKAGLDRCPFDYVIASLHFAGAFPVDASPEHWEALSGEGRNEIWRVYWINMAKMAESRLGDIIGHLDLPKKFGVKPTVDFSREEEIALDAIAASGAAVEINTAGWHVPAAQAYPSLRLLKETCARNIPLVINADAHVPAHLHRDFEKAKALAKEAGYREVVRFEKRKMFPVMI